MRDFALRVKPGNRGVSPTGTATSTRRARLYEHAHFGGSYRELNDKTSSVRFLSLGYQARPPPSAWTG
jgi:hypothetical protein